MQMEPVDNSLTEDFWRNVPVVDATELITLFPKRFDLERARPGDPENCVYARCLKRVLPTARRVRIWRGVALVESRNKKGETIALRYIIGEAGQKTLKKFDLGVGELHACTLLPPTHTTTLAAERIRARIYRDKNKEKINKRQKEANRAKNAGIYKPNRTTKAQNDFLIRNGSGHSKSAVI